MKAKKLISALLLVCLLASVMSVGAFADEGGLGGANILPDVPNTITTPDDASDVPPEAPAAPQADPVVDPVVKIRASSTSVKVGETISLGAEVDIGGNSGVFGHWEIDRYGGDGNGEIDNVRNPNITFKATKAGQVTLIAYSDKETAKEAIVITVSEVRTPVVACDVNALTQPGYKAWFYVQNAEQGETFKWDVTTSPSGVNIISDKKFYETGVDVYAGKGSGSVTVTATNKDGKSGSLTIPVNSVDGLDTSIAPNTVTWSKGQGNLTFTVEPNFYSAYIDGVCFTGSGNTGKYSYVWSSKNLVINSSYLSTLSVGTHTLRVDTVYDNGTSAGSVYATITINGSASAIFGDNAHVRGNSNNLVFTSGGGVNRVYISNQLIDPANYTLSSDGKTLTLKANFLNLLNYGTYTMKLETLNGGTETTSFRIVTANYAPATGDESNLAIWVAIMLLSGAGALALIPRRKKEM